ncbi:Uncharacterized protein Fot_14750 [Forsythia ovata]|uniref:Peptidase S1 domain-containing protein n=1 Tax=Forsythia ovata TaxID=205694 RepID=A0ABD1W777_9LAMI
MHSDHEGQILEPQCTVITTEKILKRLDRGLSGSGHQLRVKLRPGRDGRRLSSLQLSSSSLPDVAAAAECSVGCDLEAEKDYSCTHDDVRDDGTFTSNASSHYDVTGGVPNNPQCNDDKCYIGAIIQGGDKTNVIGTIAAKRIMTKMQMLEIFKISKTTWYWPCK